MDTARPPLSDAEREVLKALWEQGPASARQVLEALFAKGSTWAYTTLATLLQRLEAKGYVSIDKGGTAHVFRAAASREDLINDHLKDLADEYCEGTPAPLMLAPCAIIISLPRRSPASAACSTSWKNPHLSGRANVDVEKHSCLRIFTLRFLDERRVMLRWTVETTLAASFLAATAYVIGRLFRLGPAARHALWLIVLLRFLMPPLWSVRVPESWFSSRIEPTTSVAANVPAPIPAIERPLSANTEESTELSEVEVVEIVREPILAPSAAIKSAAKPVEPVGEFDRAIVWTLRLWAVGSILFFMIAGVRVIHFRRGLKRAKPASGTILAEWEDLARTFGIKPPDVLVTRRVDSPMLWCAGRVRLMLPERLLKKMPVDRLRCVLAHRVGSSPPPRSLGRSDRLARRVLLVVESFVSPRPPPSSRRGRVGLRRLGRGAFFPRRAANMPRRCRRLRISLRRAFSRSLVGHRSDRRPLSRTEIDHDLA